MSSVQPENGLPERRVITADSFRALKLKLAGASARPAASSAALSQPHVIFAPPPPPVMAESVEALPDCADPVPPPEMVEPEIATLPEPTPEESDEGSPVEAVPNLGELAADEATEAQPPAFEDVFEEPLSAPGDQPLIEPDSFESTAGDDVSELAEEPSFGAGSGERAPASTPSPPLASGFVERRVLEGPQPETAEAGITAHALLDIMAIPTEGSLPQERALANDTLLRLIPRMPLKSLRHLAERVCLMEMPSQMLVRRLINDPRIEVSGPLLEHAMTVDDSDLIAVVQSRDPAKLKMMARRRIISPALSEALIRSDDVETLINLVRNQGASFSVESMWDLTRFAAAYPALQAPLVTRPDTPSPIAFQLFWQLPSELRRYVLSRFLTDSETINRILTMNRENDGKADRRPADPSLLAKLVDASPKIAGEIYSRLTHVSRKTGARIADDPGGEALTVALKAAGLTRAQFAGIVESRGDAEALKGIFETLSFNKARVLLTYWDWAARRTGPYARIAAS